jgi:hypothetical protein
LSRVALLTGTAGGIIGTITAAIGIIWILILNTFLTEIHDYLVQLGVYLTSLIPTGFSYSYPLMLPFYPSASLFGVSSFILVIFLIMTGILIGIGFYGTYKIGGGAMGVVGFIFGIIGITAGALLIIMGNLTTGYMKAPLFMGEIINYFFPISTPNFLVIFTGFIIMGVAFILLGSASMSVREVTQKYSTSYAAGVLSIVGAVVFIIGGLMQPIILIIGGGEGGLIDWPIILTIGFGLILVAFILWAVVFYSSRNM